MDPASSHSLRRAIADSQPRRTGAGMLQGAAAFIYLGIASPWIDAPRHAPEVSSSFAAGDHGYKF